MKLREQAISLAGIWQSLDLVHQLAKNGELDAPQRRRFDSAIESLFVHIDENSSGDSAAKVFGGIQNLEYGLHGLAFQLEQVNKRQQVMLYMVQIFSLQRLIAKNSAMSARIASRLTELHRQHEYFSSDHPTLVENVADLYVETLGKLPMNKRIRVYGKKEYLELDKVQQSIRALLLTAVRAAMLWSQVGGRRLGLLFGQRKLLKEIYALNQ